MSDIVERLKDAHNRSDPLGLKLASEAAAEIERIRELVAFNEDQRRMLFDAACKPHWDACVAACKREFIKAAIAAEVL